jgi:hypothetical protein
MKRQPSLRLEERQWRSFQVFRSGLRYKPTAFTGYATRVAATVHLGIADALVLLLDPNSTETFSLITSEALQYVQASSYSTPVPAEKEELS